MNAFKIIVTFIVCLFLFTGSGVSVAEETVYGWQLMSEQERMAHREKMRSLKTEQEREAYRLEHHKRMQERAREKGMKLPEDPEAVGKGMGGGPRCGGSPKGGGAGKNR